MHGSHCSSKNFLPLSSLLLGVPPPFLRYSLAPQEKLREAARAAPAEDAVQWEPRRKGPRRKPAWEVPRLVDLVVQVRNSERHKVHRNLHREHGPSAPSSRSATLSRALRGWRFPFPGSQMIVDNIDGVESLDGFPDVGRRQIAARLGEIRKLTPEAARLFTRGEPGEAALADCTLLPEEELTDAVCEAVTPKLQARPAFRPLVVYTSYSVLAVASPRLAARF